MFDNDKLIEKVILFAADMGNGGNIDDNLDELEELVKTAGAVVAGRMTQKKEHIDAATYLGSGKVIELAEMVKESGATGVVCDDELSPMQLTNLERILDTKIMDRTMIILDIFAAHAATAEGKIQVELAQLKYRSSRLIGMRNSLSRLGGGIGTRGPGEKKLEVDRRIIRDRISHLSHELEDVKQHRDVMRRQRMESSLPIVAIVGYTNAGKSTLLNHLTDAGVLEADKLFATLDPTSRNFKLYNGQEIIMTDTVGFINKLPHHLINAFRSTLEEAGYADIIVHVVDASNVHADMQMLTVYDTLHKLNITDKPVVTAINKTDRPDACSDIKDLKADYIVNISAKKEIGLDRLQEILAEIINKGRILVEKTIPYADAAILDRVHRFGTLLEEEYREDGIYIKAYIDKSLSI